MQILTNNLLAALAFSDAVHSARACNSWPNAQETLQSRQLRRGRNFPLRRRMTGTPVPVSAVETQPATEATKLLRYRQTNNIFEFSEDFVQNLDSAEPFKCVEAGLPESNEEKGLLSLNDDDTFYMTSAQSSKDDSGDKTQLFPNLKRYAVGLGGIVLAGIGMSLSGFEVRECWNDWEGGDKTSIIDDTSLAFIYILLIFGVGLLCASLVRKDIHAGPGTAIITFVMAAVGAGAGAFCAAGINNMAIHSSGAATGYFCAGGGLLFITLALYYWVNQFDARNKAIHYHPKMWAGLYNLGGSVCLLAGLGYMTHVIAEDITVEGQVDQFDVNGLSGSVIGLMLLLLTLGSIWFSHVFISKWDYAKGNTKWAFASAVTFSAIAGLMVLGAHGAAMGSVDFMVAGFANAGAILVFMVLLKIVHLRAPGYLEKVRKCGRK